MIQNKALFRGFNTEKSSRTLRLARLISWVARKTPQAGCNGSVGLERAARRDSFAKALAKVIETKLGEDAEEVAKVLTKEGLSRSLATDALEIARQQGRFTIFAVVDALTRLSQRVSYAGDRVEIDAQVGTLLALAT